MTELLGMVSPRDKRAPKTGFSVRISEIMQRVPLIVYKPTTSYKYEKNDGKELTLLHDYCIDLNFILKMI